MVELDRKEDLWRTIVRRTGPDGPGEDRQPRGAAHAHISPVRRRGGDAASGPGGAGVLEDGVTVAQWCLTETLRVYETLGLQRECLVPPERFLRRLPQTVLTAQAKVAAEQGDVARRTSFKWLNDL